MKLSKIFGLSLATLLLAGCSSNDDNNFTWNTKEGVTVSMEEAEVVTIENLGLFRVPVNISGERNGSIKIQFSFIEVGDEPAMEDVHYYVTTSELVVGPDIDKTYVEINTVDNIDENDPRVFDIVISKVEYASIGELASTEVIIKDKGPYSKMAGEWTFAAANADGPVDPVKVKLTCKDPNERIIYVENLEAWFGFPSSYPMKLRLNWVWDEETEHGNVTIPMGNTMGMIPLNLGDGKGTPCDLMNIFLNGNTPVSYGSLAGTCNDNYSEISFNPSDQFVIGAFDQETGQYYGALDACSEISFKREVAE
ncbi:MAG: hypothetical protein K2L30_07085 [Duncaniella sp.]|nr:hypothetical protein [Duncaniella sp.]